MAADGDGGTSAGDIAVRLETKTTSLVPLRAGLIYAPGHGRAAFTVPGMPEFFTRQVTD